MEIFDINKFKKISKTKLFGKNIIYLKKIDSTNSYASILEKKIASSGKIGSSSKLNGTVILSETQSHGRGRFGRAWLSPAGGLWFTIMLVAPFEEKELPNTTVITAISIAEILRKDYSIRAYIKWPNDIYYKKNKLGGILTETEKVKGNVFLNIGIGLNVNLDMEDFKPYAGKAISVKSITGKVADREMLLSKILYNFEKYYEYYIKTKDLKTIFNKMENFFVCE